IDLAQRGVKTIHLFIGHTHWDHITGFPFFTPMYIPDVEVHLYAPVGYEKGTQELFSEMLAYAFFPVRLDEMQAKFHVHQMRDGDTIHIGGLTLETHYTHHPGSTLGFKVRSPTHTIGYITDNEMLLGYHGHPDAIDINHPLLEPHLSLIHFLTDCDLIIHEAQYFPEEYEHKVGWGHSSIANATVLLKHTGCQEWLVTHHDPQHSDTDLHIKLQMHQDVIADCHLHTNIRLAFDGMTLPL
ncbi:MAG TPA: MBL fold metallo-hydrolase, partial [Chlamydiales bacterium]|nr:MBL fold metallo-hydrolase [Chlamydiales bacterium]